MPCYKPLEAWRSLERTSKGKNKIVFRQSANTTHKINLPCGQCIGCRLERSLQWAIRCVNENQFHQQSSFITLTYSPEHLPWDGSLHKPDFQKFMKKLRKKTGQKIRYFMCGEYGEQLQRPHYHALLFGIDFPDKTTWSQTEGITTYQSDALTETWGKGYTTVGEVNFETAAYTARYITKKITGDAAEDHYTTTNEATGEIIHLQPEYCAMSLKPAIAKEWYEKYKSDCYPSDYLIRKSAKVKIPRYFDKLLEIENPHCYEDIKLKRKINAAKQRENNTPERLHVREKIKLLKHKQLVRSYEHDT